MKQERPFFEALNSMGWLAHVFYVATVYLCGDLAINGLLITIFGDSLWISIIGFVIFAFFGIVLLITGAEWIRFIRSQIRSRSSRS